MVATNWVSLYKKYRGLWVALKDDEKTVIVAGKNLEEVSKKAEAKGFSQPIFMQIPSKFLGMVG